MYGKRDLFILRNISALHRPVRELCRHCDNVYCVFFFVVARIQINMYCVLVFVCVCVALYLDSGVLCCVSAQRCVVLYNVITFYLYSVVCLYSVVKRVVRG